MYDKIIFWRPFLKQHYQLAASGLKDISIFKKLSQSDRRDSSFIGSVNSLCAFREQVVRLVGRSVGRSSFPKRAGSYSYMLQSKLLFNTLFIFSLMSKTGSFESN